MSRAKVASDGRPRCRPVANPIPGLEAQVRLIASQLKGAFHESWAATPLVLRDQAVGLLRRALTPKKRLPGARRTLTVDKAYRKWRGQLRQRRLGERRRVSWLKIAHDCIGGFRFMDDVERKLRLRRLQNAVYNRAHRAWKRIQRRQDRRTDSHNEAAEPSA